MRTDNGFDILIALARLYQVFGGNNAGPSRGREYAAEGHRRLSVIGALLRSCVLHDQTGGSPDIISWHLPDVQGGPSWAGRLECGSKVVITPQVAVFHLPFDRLVTNRVPGCRT
jgi:hypothetical protein